MTKFDSAKIEQLQLGKRDFMQSRKTKDKPG